MADETKVRWQHGETGRVCELPRNQHPGKGWSPLSAHGWWDVRDMAAAWLADRAGQSGVE